MRKAAVIALTLGFVGYLAVAVSSAAFMEAAAACCDAMWQKPSVACWLLLYCGMSLTQLLLS